MRVGSHLADRPLGLQRNKIRQAQTAGPRKQLLRDKYVDKLNLVEEYARGETFGLIPVILAM